MVVSHGKARLQICFNQQFTHRGARRCGNTGSASALYMMGASVEIECRHPPVVSKAPRGLAGVANVVAKQEAFELMPGLHSAVDGVFARSRQIPDRLVVRVGYPDGAQLSSASTRPVAGSRAHRS